MGNISVLALPRKQLDDILKLTKSSTSLVLVLVQGRPRLITQVAFKVDAIIMAGLPGFEGAEAIAQIISGRVNPSGKLPISYPEHTGHLTTYNHKPSDVYFYEGGDPNEIKQGNRDTSLFPFGHGLSYTTFEYSDLIISRDSVGEGEEIRAEVTITNVGDRAGMECVLWYLINHVGRITRPVKELKSFEKVLLEPGKSVRAEFLIKPLEHFSYPDQHGELVLDSGRYTVKVGDLKKEFNFEASD